MSKQGQQARFPTLTIVWIAAAAAGGGVGGKAKIWIGADRGLAIAGNSSMAASHPGEPSRQTAIVHRAARYPNHLKSHS